MEVTGLLMPEYICEYCGEEFDKPEELYEPDGLDTPPYRYSLACPYCKSGDIRQVVARCMNCSEYILSGDKCFRIRFTDEYYCKDCIVEGVAD